MDRRERLDSSYESLVAALMGWQAKLWTALPGIIESWDSAKNTCSVRPALKCVQLSPQGVEVVVSMPLLVDCPVVFPGGGGFTMSFPLTAGDECLVVFASRCIDAWWQSGGEQQQAEFRMHDLSDGFVLPGVRSVPRVPPLLSTSNVTLRNDSGDVFVALTPDKTVLVQTPELVSVSAKRVDVTASQEVNVTAVTVNIDAHVVVTGDVDITGAVTATGSITSSTSTVAPVMTASSSLTVNGIEMKTHTHAFIDNDDGASADVTQGPQ